MMKEALSQLIRKEDLTYETAYRVASEMMGEAIDPLQTAAILTGLKVKGETYEEISGFAKGLKDHAVRLAPKSPSLYDIVGTGGDGANTFNISTTCAIVLSGAGLSLAKHGNRSISSRCGSADVLEALGVDIQASPGRIVRQLDDLGLTFIFAPLAHPAMRNVMPIRRGLGIPTIFNIIGPLANPLNLTGQVIGVFDESLVLPMARSMILLGIQDGAVIHGHGGLDELSLSGPNTVAFIRGGEIDQVCLDAKDFGLTPCENAVLTGGGAEENAAVIRDILDGKAGPHRDVVLLNCGVALAAFGKTGSIQQGIAMAAESIDSGKARGKLLALVSDSLQKEVS